MLKMTYKNTVGRESGSIMIKLSTGAIVPEIKNLTYGQLTFLGLKPIEEDMPDDLKDYLKKATKRWLKTPLKYERR